MPPVDYSTLPELLEKQAGIRPNATALLAPGRLPLTYGRLWEQARAQVEVLNSFGIGRRDRVAMVLPNGPEAAAAFLAVACAATAAPLNPAYRQSEFECYLSDLRATALLTPAHADSPAVSVARALGLPVVELSPIPEAEAGIFSLSCATSRSAPPLSGFSQVDDFLMVLHTSGTTGRPKVVPARHRHLQSQNSRWIGALRLTEGDRCCNLLPLFHVGGLGGGLCALLAAGAAVICPPTFEPAGFYEWLDELRPTFYSAGPTVHRAIISRADEYRGVIARCPLRFVRTGTAPMPRQLILRIEETMGAPLIESYGMTEAALISTNPLPPGRRKLGSVGFSTGLEIAILDESGGRLPPSRVGEIGVRGADLFEGYERNPEANAAAFRGGWFRTGDVGYFDEEGYLFLSGRIKEMINRGGEKVSPYEVETALLDHSAVAEAAVFALPDDRLGEDVAAAVVPWTGRAVTERELRSFARRALADFKVPRRLFFVEELPKGPTGKVRRAELASSLGLTEAKLARGEAPPLARPRDALEETLADVWRDLLRAEPIGVFDSFFDLGGESLLAARMLARVGDITGEEIPLSDFFVEPTIAGLADLVVLRLAESPATAPGD